MSSARRDGWPTYSPVTVLTAMLARMFPIGVALAVFAYAVYLAASHDGFELQPRAAVDPGANIFSFALLCGAASAATVEVFKRLFGLRGLYQHRQLLRRLGHHGVGALLHGIGRKGPQRVPLLFNLPMEHVAAQINAAVDIALADPYRHIEFLETIAAAPLRDELSVEKRGEDDWHRELTQRVHSGIDQLQISIGERWRQYVQSTALALSGVYGIIFAGNAAGDHDSRPAYILVALVGGGALSWVIRDVSAIIERWRR